MVSIGGLVTDVSMEVSSDGPESLGYNSLPDPWLQGLGIFDLTAMEWKEEYDPAAAPYVTPDVVKAYYQRNGRGPASWTNDIVQAWFTKTTWDHTDSRNYTDPRSSPSIPHAGLSSLPGSSKSSTGAIAGGTVGGVVAFMLIALGASIFIRRHLPISRWTFPPSDIRYRRPEKTNNCNERIPGVSHHLCELQGTNDPIELPEGEIAATELPWGFSSKEMPA